MAFERTDTSSGGGVTLNAPADNYESILSGVEFNATATIPGATLINMSLWHNATGTFELNQTNSTIDLTTNITTFDANFGVGEYSWNIQGCDSDGDCGFGESNRTIKIANLIENSQTYTSPTVEGTSNPFIVNVTYTSANWNVITGILTYNNTEYSGTKSGTGDTILFTSSTAAPNVDTQTNVTFYWTMGINKCFWNNLH